MLNKLTHHTYSRTFWKKFLNLVEKVQTSQNAHGKEQETQQDHWSFFSIFWE